MVRQLDVPQRPLPTARIRWTWTPQPAAPRWRWCRVYHRSSYTPDGVTFRRFGPLHRLDHHQQSDPPQLDSTGRRVLYVGGDLATSASEVFGEAGIAAICPQYRVSIVTPTRPLAVFDLASTGAAMAIGALPSLADGNEPRLLTQQWARSIFEDQPAGSDVCGVRYRTAYNFGYSLALWDCDDSVEIVQDRAGRVQDLPLQDPRMLGRLQVEMRKRRIAVTTITENDCTLCTRP
ncbi:RES domain-containing protein [Mycobacteroides chelonae]|uniref:RES domain-containing protein n=1 Tax=Mycobacteroides chelonae TaxID=1774 RepID=UPI0009922CFF|nr:RES domain-containing protein [Mycobacteroides chelonae]